MGFKPDEQPALSPITGSESIHASDVSGDSVSITAQQIADLAGGGDLKSITFVVTNAQMEDLIGTPVAFLSGVSGKVIDPLSVVCVKAAGNGYASGFGEQLEMVYENSGDEFAAFNSSILASAPKTVFRVSSGDTRPISEGEGIVIVNSGGTELSGGAANETLTINVFYRELSV